ncbi:MAG: phosphoglucosamine mutase [Dehalococcoidales bacterium]|jgi:phosphoglucosamine mutase|nr:phosphoglucosamine mutase [Dehalococcoidales bacterium]MDP6576355.1 phosphoglucosamine mutase [Dehalococcoidales bacterium]MDP6824670.1 phosphoglucosamine mutase [Dehalococcoidales bacterium]
MRLFGTSGIRAVFDRDLLHLALKVGRSVGSIYPEVIVGGDTRTSSGVLKHAVITGLLASGARCQDAGVVPTPTLALAAGKFNAGVMVTASHNPPQYNGLKFINPDGSSFGSGQQALIEEMIFNESPDVTPWNSIKESGVYRGAVEQHVGRIIEDFPAGFNLKVALDCACGAASVITPYLLRKLGCAVVEINCIPGGVFPHPVEPTESNLAGLIRAIGESGAELGIAHDGDADRMMAVDDRGRFIPGDKLLVILAQAMKAQEVVTTLDTSMVVEKAGFGVRRTRIGDTWVSEELRNGGDFGGEPSGSWIFPGVSLCPDGIYAAAQMVAIASRQKLSQLVANIPGYSLLRDSVSSDGVAVSCLESSLMALEPLSVSRVDGIKLNFEDGWLLVRASGTEPKIRLTTEAKSQARVRKLHNNGLRVVKSCIAKSKERMS